MTNHDHKHTSPGNRTNDSQPPTRKEVNRVIFRFVLFFGISIWLFVLSIKNGFPNADVYPDYRGRGISSSLPFLVFPVIATLLLGADLIRLHRRRRHASQRASAARGDA